MCKSTDMADDDLLATAEVAALVHRTVATVNRWAIEGRLRPAMKLPRRTGANLFRLADVEAFLAERDAA